MNKKIKVITVVGTRPEIIRLSRVLSALDNSSAIEHILIHTGQNYDYELNEIFFNDLEIRKPDYYIGAAGKNAVSTIGNILTKIDDYFEQFKPDALLILGDTNSCLCSIAAKKRMIPIFHMEAGNRCFDQRVPEETNRKIVDHISDINLTYSSIAREYLLREGISADKIIKTGSPMFEVLQFYKKKILESNILNKLLLKPKQYILVSAHREENINNVNNFNNLFESLNNLADKFNYPIIFSTHPRTKNKINELKINLNNKIVLLNPLSFSDYNNLQLNSFVVLSDSGTISEEASILKFDALNIREAHERPEAMEEASVMLVGLKYERILQGILHLKDQNENKLLRNVSDYSMPNVSEKIVKIIISYIDYINLNVWKK